MEVFPAIDALLLSFKLLLHFLEHLLGLFDVLVYRMLLLLVKFKRIDLKMWACILLADQRSLRISEDSQLHQQRYEAVDHRSRPLRVKEISSEQVLGKDEEAVLEVDIENL